MEAGREREKRGRGGDARHKMTGGEGEGGISGMVAFGRLDGDCDMEGQETERACGMEKERSPDFSSVDVVFVNGHASVHWFMFESMFLILAFCFDLCTTMQSQNGNTALDHARSGGQDEVVKLLEEAAEKKRVAAPARGDPDEPRDEVSLHASTCASKRQAAG
jgi:hypothetical protein